MRTVAGRDVGRWRKRARTCEGCGCIYVAPKPFPDQCLACGDMRFLKFDSEGEAKRWAELRLLEDTGQIKWLQRQVRLSLHAAGADATCSKPVRLGVVVMDFIYMSSDGKTHFEDFKGGRAITDLARWKLAHVNAEYNVTVEIST